MERIHTAEELHQLAHVFSTTVLGFEPPAYARMQGPRAEKKYLKIHRPLTTSLIQAHLAGQITVATSLIDHDGQARATVLDIDSGGAEALRRVLDYAAIAGLSAFAQTSTTEEHDGGHVWILFEKPTTPERLRKLGERLYHSAQVEAEVYPTRKAIRLPLGIHTWTGKRGTLIFQNGEVVDLDQPATEIRTAVAKIAALPKNSLSLLPTVERPSKQARESHSGPISRATEAKPIQDYNRHTDLLEFVLRAGGRIAEQYPDGRFLVHCPCGNHKHSDAKPSLEIQPAKNTSRYGRYVAVGYSPGCLFHTQRGHVVDAFSAYCMFEQLTTANAVKQLSSGQQRQPRRQREPHTHRHEGEAQKEETDEPSHERQRRRAEARQLHIEIKARAAADTDLPERAKVILDALLSFASNRTWCRPSVPGLAEAANKSSRTVYRALADLERRGYIESEEPNGATTTIRRFLRVTADCETNTNVSSVLDLNIIPTPTGFYTCEPPHDSEAASQEASGAAKEDDGIVNYADGASYEPPRPRRRQQKDPIQKRFDQRRRRLERWKKMDIHQLERERYVLTATAKRSQNPRQQAALEYQVKELEHELGKKRDAGIQAMTGTFRQRRRAGQEIEPSAPRLPASGEPRGASQVTSVKPSLDAQELCSLLGTDPEYSAWAHRRFAEMLARSREREGLEYASGTGLHSPV